VLSSLSAAFNEWILSCLIYIQVTEQCLEKGIAVCKDGVEFKEIGKVIRYDASNPPITLLGGFV